MCVPASYAVAGMVWAQSFHCNSGDVLSVSGTEIGKNVTRVESAVRDSWSEPAPRRQALPQNFGTSAMSVRVYSCVGFSSTSSVGP
ncbi:hypothetical protein DFO66_11938 [Brevibacterium sanguinis]|uniref:Uncharacterized protein n=2 Tax=Brevibacterium TaxID=1696 RepID=A0A366IML4_9MICO|nr:hypothetical protein DFO66_11938 [Brevibacterium sanguinis]RBP74305.1 hypothetical protein DFO65_10122 [Brevibacterium celere]